MSFKEIWALYKPYWSVEIYIGVTVLIVVLFMICLGLLLFHQWTKQQCFSTWILGAYLIILFVFTVFGRWEMPEYEYELELFWSYSRGMTINGREMMRQIIMNILMLVPIGVILPSIIGDRFKRKLTCGIVTILTGFVISATIEILQFVLKRGLFEFDDMFHNTLGTALGVLIYYGLGKAKMIVCRKNR